MLTIEQLKQLYLEYGDARDTNELNKVLGMFDKLLNRATERGEYFRILYRATLPNRATRNYVMYYNPAGQPVLEREYQTETDSGFGSGDCEGITDPVITPWLVDALYQWNLLAFGPGKRTAGIIDHIKKELVEINNDPDDLEEWIDVILLALNGAQRLGASGDDILSMLLYKIDKNSKRNWPDWRSVPADKAIEHTK